MRRLSFWIQGLCLTAATMSFAAQAQDVVDVKKSTKITVTQVVVSGDRGDTYVMKTLQPMDSDLVVVTSDMAKSARPFSVVNDQFTVAHVTEPVSGISETGKPLELPQIRPGVREVHAHYFNDVYDVVYLQDGRWMHVETLEEPQNGKLLLTDALKRASRAL